MSRTNAIPVILDTDIGIDIDDTWALGMLLNCPELDVKLAVSATGDTTYRAKIIAKFLQKVGRTDIPVGVGANGDNDWFRKLMIQKDWVADYDLAKYPGTVHADGVAALIDTIMSSDQEVVVLAIGPLPNLAEALRREPRITARSRIVAMAGGLRYGYGRKPEVQKEYNIANNVPAAQAVFTSDWDLTITPLDTCSVVGVRGENYQRFCQADTPITRAILENWKAVVDRHEKRTWPTTGSSTLFDCLGIYMGFTTRGLVMEDLPVRVTDDGWTRIEEGAKVVHVAAEWDGPAAKDEFETFMTDRLVR